MQQTGLSSSFSGWLLGGSWCSRNGLAWLSGGYGAFPKSFSQHQTNLKINQLDLLCRLLVASGGLIFSPFALC
jgi:hypothetical protein